MGMQRRKHFFMVENHVVDDWIKIIGPGGFAVYSLVLRRYNEKNRTTRYIRLIHDLGRPLVHIFNESQLIAGCKQ